MKTRRDLARKLAVITTLTAADIEAQLGVLTEDDLERFLTPGADLQRALDLATLRRVAPGIERRSYPSLQLFPLPDDRPIPNGAHRSVRGSKGFYTVCNHGGRLFCDCPSFAFSKEPQTCKHVRGLEPEQYGKKG